MRCHVAAWRARGRANGSSLVRDATPGAKGPSSTIEAVTSASDPAAVSPDDDHDHHHQRAISAAGSVAA
jgi:hypothetical protein